MANLLVKRQTTNLLFMSNNIHLLELSHYEAPVIKEVVINENKSTIVLPDIVIRK